jgi:hypothetical protein
MKGSAIVIIGVGRHGVGRNNSFADTSSPTQSREGEFSKGGYLVSMPRAQRG